jgi:PRC-barrel domain
MTEATFASLPSLAEARDWIGFDVDEIGGKRIGAVHGVYVDAESGAPTWLIARLGRRRRAKPVAVPVSNCGGAAGRVWVASEGKALAGAPAVDPTRPLLREHELAICAHYGIGERVGRAAEVLGRSEGDITSRPSR